MSYSDSQHRSSESMDGLRVPPHSVEAEQAVLGGLMLDASAWDGVADLIAGPDFYRRDHQLVFEAIAGLVHDSKPCDAVTVSESLSNQGIVDEVGGLAYLARLTRDTPSAANVRAYAHIVRDNALLRALVHAGGEIASGAFNPQGRAPIELVQEAEQLVFAIAERGARSKAGFVSVRDVLPKTIDRIDALHQNPDAFSGVSTGYTDLDKLTTGLHAGDLVIIAGRPSMGKTTLALNIAENAAIDGKVPVAVFSMEMSAEQLTMRMISSLGRISQSSLRKGTLSAEDWPRITSATEVLSNSPIYIDESGGLTPTEVRARARRLKREHGVGLIVVDYLQLMTVAGGKENRATEISEISRSLKALAKELECPVIALSQLNRSVEQRTEKRPVMSDLRECVAGDTQVCLTDGRRVPIRELVGQVPTVWAMDAREQIVAANADLVWKVGTKPVFDVRLASGRSLRATAEHRVYTSRGWQTVAQLSPGDRMAIARQIPESARPMVWNEAEVILLGHLVGGDSACNDQPIRYTTGSAANATAVREAAEQLGSDVVIEAGRRTGYQLRIVSGGGTLPVAGVSGWLQRVEIAGQRAEEKRLPNDALRMPNHQVGLLLRHLWAAGGRIQHRAPEQGGATRIYFKTGSEGLARDVAALLLRLGIVARIHATLAGSRRPVFSVDVADLRQQRLFLEAVGAFGPRLGSAAKLTSVLRSKLADVGVAALAVPAAAAGGESRAYALRGDGGAQTAACSPATGGSISSDHQLPSDAARHAVVDQTDRTPFPPESVSSLFWDRIVAVQAAGEEDVYDLTVPGPACWLADGIVTHNSGAIEQDADLILMIYREEVYEPSTPRKGIADIIITKQRNGPTGEVHLTFLGEYTRFENLASESYGEGAFR